MRKHFYFSGTVQGVGFRFRSMNIAHELHITGWVRNMYDGRVECEAQGTPEQLNNFVLRLKKEPWVHIDDIEERAIPESKNEKDFIVAYRTR